MTIAPDARPSRYHAARYLYGSADGRWLMVEAPAGTTPPEALDGMPRLGTLPEAIQQATEQVRRTDPRPVGASTRLSNALGVDPKVWKVAVSRGSVPALTSYAWKVLVKILHGAGDHLVPPGPPIGRQGPPDEAVEEASRVAAALRAERITRGLRQEDVGKEAGVSQSRIAAFESGRQVPTAAAQRRWAAALGRLDLLPP